MRKKLHLVALLACLTVVALAGCGSKGPTNEPVTLADADVVEFARSTFGSLSRGEVAAADKIDWERFKAMAQDVGRMYNMMPSDSERKAFRESFIKSFSKSFTDKGASADSLSNWRVDSKETTKVVVAASTPNGKSLKVTVTTSGGQPKMSGLDAG